VTVKIVTPADAASSPSHPDHARWVKERTLAVEADHARRVGASLRDAEIANTRQLERLEARKRIKRPVKKPSRKRSALTPRNEEHQRLADAGVIKRPAPVEIVKPRASPCNWCGLCISCKREARLRSIMARARNADVQAHKLTMELVAITFAASSKKDYKDAIGRELPFSRLRGGDAARARIAGAEWVCDRSVSFMGEWR
jgi:hypothetical protein